MIGADPRHTSRQRGLVIDESVEEPEDEDKDVDQTPYPSLASEALKKGQTLISFFNEIISKQGPSKPPKPTLQAQFAWDYNRKRTQFQIYPFG